MKLDRNVNGDGRGKYGLIKNRELKDADDNILRAISVLEDAGLLEWGTTPETEFFVMRLKDRCAGPALHQYAAHAIHLGELEYGREVGDLARRSGEWHPLCKMPD